MNKDMRQLAEFCFPKSKQTKAEQQGQVGTMHKYIAIFDAGMPGTETHEAILALGPQEAYAIAYAIAYEMAMEWFDMYDHYENDATEEEVDDKRSEVSPAIEAYDPEKHDGYKMDGSKDWDWI